MLVGHFAVSLASQRFAPKLSLGTLVMAAMASDLIWPPLTLAGIEHVRFKPGLGRAVEMMDADIAYSHGLLTCVLIAIVFAAVHFGRWRDRLSAWIIAAAVISHWVLDLVSHPPDMALAPGLPQRFGLNLWSSIPATLAVEGLLWVIAIVLFVRTNRTAGWQRTSLFWGGIVILTLSWLSNITSPPPPNLLVAMLTSFLFFGIMVVWGFWVSRLDRRGMERMVNYAIR